MKNFTIPIAVLVVLLNATALVAESNQDLVPESVTYQQYVDRFFQQLEHGEFKVAIEQLYQTNPWMAKIEDQVDKVKGQFSTLPDMAGEIHSYDLLIEQPISDRFVMLWYVVSFDRTPVSFRFWFYRPGDSWLLFAFQYEDDLQNMAVDLAKRRILSGDRTCENEPSTRKALESILNGGSL